MQFILILLQPDVKPHVNLRTFSKNDIEDAYISLSAQLMYRH